MTPTDKPPKRGGRVRPLIVYVGPARLGRPLTHLPPRTMLGSSHRRLPPKRTSRGIACWAFAIFDPCHRCRACRLSGVVSLDAMSAQLNLIPATDHLCPLRPRADRAHACTVREGGPAVHCPMMRASGYPASTIVCRIAAARSGAHATRRPPEVCGSVSRCRRHSGKADGSITLSR